MLGATLVPVAWRALDPAVTVVLAAMFVILSAAIYALHAVTFDFFRLSRVRNIFFTGGRDE